MITSERKKVLDEYISDHRMTYDGLDYSPAQNTEEREYLYVRLKKKISRVSFIADNKMPIF